MSTSVQIIHGDNTILSYNRLNQLGDTTMLDISQLTLSRVRQETAPQDLFGNTKQVIIKDLLTSTKSKSKDSIVDFLAKNQDLNLVLYESKTIPATTLKKFSSSKIEVFKVESGIFKFLDKIKPNNQKDLLDSYQKLIKNEEVEYLFAMILRQIRLLIQAKFDPATLKIPPYPAKLVTNQAKYFDPQKLLELHHQLYEIDKGIKSGILPGGLELHLEHFLLTI